MTQRHKVIICGAGITGISAAYYLAKSGLQDILVIDERPPLTLTSDRSTECYRNWWPDHELLALMNHSIDLMDELAIQSNNVFRMNRRGYLYVTGDPVTLPLLIDQSRRISSAGGGPLRIHEAGDEDYEPTPRADTEAPARGADLLLWPDLIRRRFPYLTDAVAAVLHVRRAGWLSAQQLGMHLLDGARRQGVKIRLGRVKEARISDGRVHGITLDTNERLDCESFVNAAGPYFREVGAMLGVDLPVVTELHMKVAFEDMRGVVDRAAPLLIWNDSQRLPWDDEERTALVEDAETLWLAGLLRGGAHARPEGGTESRTLLMLWDYRERLTEPDFPPVLDDQYPEVVLRGLSAMLPGLRAYVGRTPRARMDGGYYVKTPENRLLVGPCPVEGAYLIGAVSGYGIMSACAAGELLAAHIRKTDLPPYAEAFSLSRYEDPRYEASMADLGERGEL